MSWFDLFRDPGSPRASLPEPFMWTDADRKAHRAQMDGRKQARLSAVPSSAPSRDEFTAWRDDPTTQFVMNALMHNADECRDEWLRLSWETGEADQRKLDGLRERSDALLGFTADYEAFCQTLGLEPEQEEQAA